MPLIIRFTFYVLRQTSYVLDLPRVSAIQQIVHAFVFAVGHLLFQFLTEFVKCQNIHFRERYRFEYSKVGILAYNEVGIGNDGTIHEFVVVGISLYKVEMELWVKAARERAAQNGS